jgi:hypothetical protein
MPLVLTELDSGYNNADATSYALNSITPAANSHLWYIYMSRHGTLAVGTTPPAAYGGTWTELGVAGLHPQVDGISAVGAWELNCSGTPGTSAMTVASNGGVTAIGLGWSIIQATGHDPVGTTVQFKYGPTATTALSGLVTLAAAGAAGNGEVGFFMHRTSEAQTAEAGWTPGTSRNGTLPNNCNMASFKVGSFDTTVTQSWVTSSRYQGLAFEVKALVTSPATDPTKFRRGRRTLRGSR